MNFAKKIALILVVLLLSCSIVACGDTTSNGTEVSLPDRPFYDITVSFQIKDATGKTVIDASNYNYKSHAEPTVLNVLDTYLTVVEDWVCKIKVDSERGTKTVTQIGGMKADTRNGEYWGFVTNASTDPKTGEVTLKDMSAINLSMDQIKKDQSSEAMYKSMLITGAEFTVILFASED